MKPTIQVNVVRFGVHYKAWLSNRQIVVRQSDGIESELVDFATLPLLVRTEISKAINKQLKKLK